MKVIGINGSPRRGWNTQTLVLKALEGAAAMGAETELIDLYAQPLKGCLECYACKRIFSPSHHIKLRMADRYAYWETKLSQRVLSTQ